MQLDRMQEIYNGSEIVTDNLDHASGCTRALIGLIDQLSDDPEFIQQSQALIAATLHFLQDARTGVDRVARLAMDGPD